MKLFLSSLVTVAVSSAVLAQQTVWGQCGGINWTGPTTCVSGTTCTHMNDWYSQCIPSPTSSQAPSSSSVPISTSSSSSVSSSSASPSSTPVTPGAVNYWFSFGDSYTQTGFTPSGDLPNDANPIGNPPFPGWTATGGANWVGFGTTTYNKSHIYTYNYAYGGATIDANLVQPYTPTVLSLTDQVNQFLTTVASKPPSTPWTSANSLFSIFIGINDIGNSFYLGGDRAAASGARTFLFATVPPIDRSPLMLNQNNADGRALEKSVIEGFNAKLIAKAADFKATHSGVTTFVWDSQPSFSRILDDPTAYGFIDATSYGSGSGIFWGNDYHPSSEAHNWFAQDVAEVLADTIW
ncbi:hypothetical protein ONZ45_g7376 [Pleurotus djamor]|nr:hypothetical protein ONZ45_g7376 [Pleurotus djamor]